MLSSVRSVVSDFHHLTLHKRSRVRSMDKSGIQFSFYDFYWIKYYFMPTKCKLWSAFSYLSTSNSIHLSRLMTKPIKMICAPSEDSDQSDPPSLIRLCADCALSWQLRTQCFFKRTAKALIRLGGCPCWSESSLGSKVILLVLSWGGSFFVKVTLSMITNLIHVLDMFCNILSVICWHSDSNGYSQYMFHWEL